MRRLTRPAVRFFVAATSDVATPDGAAGVADNGRNKTGLMEKVLPVIDSLERRPAPAPAPIGIAYDGARFWVGSVETDHLYALDPKTGSPAEEWAVPGTPYGIVALGGELRVVVGDADSDDRSIARFVPGTGFSTDRLACPEATGSFLAAHGDALFLSQRFEHRIFEFDRGGNVRRTIPVRRETTGMTLVDGALYLVTTESKEVDDYRVVRLDLTSPDARETELASLPVSGRGLAHDGARFWTNLRAENAMLAFALP